MGIVLSHAWLGVHCESGAHLLTQRGPLMRLDCDAAAEL
jgi:hypothetical protein